MPQVRIYDPADRQLQKERNRASDTEALRLGLVSSEELWARNGFFSSFEIMSSSVACQEGFA